MTNIHLISGFLGSGKTTAIINAARLLMSQGRKVGVITNDQGKYLVDTAFFRLASVPAMEVTGGCFCCNFDDLEGRLAQLLANAQPDVIMAESVGSCADLVATVIRPLIELGSQPVQPASFSVFTDIRLLRRRLRGEDMPFSDDVVYIYDKQIEEAGLLVVNKVDLVSPAVVGETARLLQDRFPAISVRFQSSLDQAGVQPWVEQIQTGSLSLSSTGLDIDYPRYGRGEALLAWLDEEVHLRFPPGTGQRCLRQILNRLLQSLASHQASIGHLKFIVHSLGSSEKLSFTTLPEAGWEKGIPAITGDALTLLVNARVELEAEKLRQLFEQALAGCGCDYTRQSSEAFHPGFPRPTHRIR